jgi:hypothetical protein
MNELTNKIKNKIVAGNKIGGNQRKGEIKD